MTKRLLFILVSILFTGITATAQSWLWGVEGSTAIKADFYANNVAVDRSDNVCQVGGFTTSITFGATTLTSINLAVYLVKYDPNGNLLWAKQSTDLDTGSASGCSVATDDSNNIYISGSIRGNEIFGKDTLYGNGNYNILLAKYDSNGNAVWGKQITTNIPNGSIGWAVATDHFGHVYLTGNGGFLFKYDRNGNLIWSTVPKSTSAYNNYTYGYSIAPDGSGNIYVSGEFTDSLIFGSYKLYSDWISAFIFKTDSNGNVLWAQQSVTVSNTSQPFGRGSYAVAVDGSGSAYLTGSFLHQMSFGSYTFTSAKDTDNNFFIVKYNPGGSIAWAKEATTVTNGSWGAYSICTDDSAHIYICGGIRTGSPTSFAFANDTIRVQNNEFDDPSFIIKLDSSGFIICDTTINGGGGSEPSAVACDNTGQFVYLGGGFLNTMVLGSDDLIDNTGGVDAYIARWKPCLNCDLALTVSPASISICPYAGATLIASGAQSYQWIPSTGLNTTTGDSVIANPTVSTTYTVNGNSGSCSSTSEVVVSIIPAPNVPTITVHGDTLISSAQYYNQWYLNDSLLVGDTSQFLIISGYKGYYFVQVTNPANGCSTNSDSTTSINQLSVISEQLSVYPNPFNNIIFVKINSAASNVNNWSLQVTDVLGRTVFVKPSLSYSNEIELSNLPGGVYFISVTSKTGRAVFPVVKQN